MWGGPDRSGPPLFRDPSTPDYAVVKTNVEATS